MHSHKIKVSFDMFCWVKRQLRIFAAVSTFPIPLINLKFWKNHFIRHRIHFVHSVWCYHLMMSSNPIHHFSFSHSKTLRMTPVHWDDHQNYYYFCLNRWITNLKMGKTIFIPTSLILQHQNAMYLSLWFHELFASTDIVYLWPQSITYSWASSPLRCVPLTSSASSKRWRCKKWPEN